jgi:hypothetical protein
MDRPGDVRPFAESICWHCANHRVIRAARSAFVMCTTLPVKYPRQPLSSCPAFHPGSSAVTDTGAASSGSRDAAEDQARAAPVDAGEEAVVDEEADGAGDPAS